MIDTFMMPYGTECDLYQIMGEIKNVESAVNEYTDEKLYFMTLSCNDMIFDICINRRIFWASRRKADGSKEASGCRAT